MAVEDYLSRYFTLRVIFLTSLVLRASLLIYGEWQDSNFAVKFTDIDYHVFTDAAKHVVDGESPFLRQTYRYTPLLAILLTPNHYLLLSFGKIIFVLSDICAGVLILQILSMRGVTKSKKAFSLSLWLLNPLTAAVSSRGNAESILALLVLATIYFIMCRRITISAVFFGLAVHMKIFPVIYSLPLYLFIDENYVTNPDLSVSPLEVKSVFERFFSPQRLKFVYISFLTFISVTGFFYVLYGREFIHKAYLHHITRRDIRHNFSVYFYILYLAQNTWFSLPIGILAFLPQILLVFTTAVWLYRDITLCCFVQTFIFVTFNKVCTSQYFLWYLCLFPLVTPYSKFLLSEALMMAVVWFLGQGLWLLSAYLLEFRGYNTFVLIWLAGLLFFAINVYILVKLLKKQVVIPAFVKGRLIITEKQISKLN